MRKHPSKEQYIELLRHQRAVSRRCIRRCTHSITRYEWHLCQIEESESELLRMGVLTAEEMWQE